MTEKQAHQVLIVQIAEFVMRLDKFSTEQLIWQVGADDCDTDEQAKIKHGAKSRGELLAELIIDQFVSNHAKVLPIKDHT